MPGLAPRNEGESTLTGMQSRLPLIVLTLACAACEPANDRAGKSSVTVRLPPPRPAIPEPGFSALPVDRVDSAALRDVV